MPVRLVATKDRRQEDFTEVRARQRLNELQRLARYRRNAGFEMGPPLAWGIVLSDIALARRRLWGADFNEELRNDLRRQIEAYFWRIGLGEMVSDPIGSQINSDVSVRIESNPMKLLPAEQVGEMLEVTAAEREECRLRTIDDVELGQSGRIRERDRARKASKRRESGARSQSESIEATKPWETEGISRRTYYRRQKTGAA